MEATNAEINLLDHMHNKVWNLIENDPCLYADAGKDMFFIGDYADEVGKDEKKKNYTEV